MTRCRTLSRRHGDTNSSREALLAATSLQLRPGDLLSPEPGDRTAFRTQPANASNTDGDQTTSELPANLRLPLCAGVARGFVAAGTQGLVLAFARAGSPEPGWADALTWAQRDRLPLIVAVADRTRRGRKATGHLLSEPALHQLASEISLPVFPVDALDAVALYRVMNEAVLRARAGGGPAVLWGMLGSASVSLTRSEEPIARLTAYLRARNIPLRP